MKNEKIEVNVVSPAGMYRSVRNSKRYTDVTQADIEAYFKAKNPGQPLPVSIPITEELLDNVEQFLDTTGEVR